MKQKQLSRFLAWRKNLMTPLCIICSIIAANVTAFADQVSVGSDTLSITNNDLSATFDGNVRVDFEDLKLTTSKLIVFYKLTDKKEITKIDIPNKLKVIKNCGQEIILADRGTFDNAIKKLTLEGNVQMQKEGNVLVTDKLVYLAQFKGIEQKNNAK